MLLVQEKQYNFILLTKKCGLGLQQVLHSSDLWQLTLKNLGGEWIQLHLVLCPGFLYGMWWKKVDQQDHWGSALKKMLAKLFTAKWHLCDWSHSDWGIVINNLDRCWACVSCVPWVSIVTATGTLAGGLCTFASATTVLIQECSVKSTLRVQNQDTDKYSVLPTQLHGKCFTAEAEQAGKYRCKT